MKSIIKILLYKFGEGSIYVVPIFFVKTFKYVLLVMYSGRIKTQLKKCGNNILFNRPFNYSGLKCITIGNDFLSLPGMRIEAIEKYDAQIFSPQIIIGNNVCINTNCHISSIDRIIINDNVLIASNVFITDHFHGQSHEIELTIPPRSRKLFSKGDVSIGENVWIGENVTILPGVHIGENSVVGANSVVTKSFPAYSVIAGVPAKLIRHIILA